MNVLSHWFTLVGLKPRKEGVTPETMGKAPTHVGISLRNAAALKRARKGLKSHG
jgi:hypothetical protein